MTQALDNVPENPQAVTAEWLTEVLRNQKVISQTVIEAIEINSLPGQEGATGQIARFSLNYRHPREEASLMWPIF